MTNFSFPVAVGDDLGHLFRQFEVDLDLTFLTHHGGGEDTKGHVLAIFFLIPLLLSFYVFFYGRETNRKEQASTVFKHQQTKLNLAITRAITEKVGEYQKPYGWYNRHVGALVALGNDLNLKYERQILHESKSELVCVDWYPSLPPAFGENRCPLRVVIVFPGLGLKSTSKFIKKFVKWVRLGDETMYVACLLTRGVGCPLKSAKGLWNPGMSADGERLIQYVHATLRSTIFLAGFSAGTNIVKNLLRSERRRLVPVHGAVCIASNNADYLTSRALLESSFVGRIYSRFITSIYKSIIHSNDHIYKEIGLEPLARLGNVALLSEYDEFAFRYLYGQYSSEEEYYASLSPPLDNFQGIPFLLGKQNLSWPHRLYTLHVGLDGWAYATSFSHSLLSPLSLLSSKVQPSDDPLHRAQRQEQAAAEFLVACNPAVVYMSTAAGNHFGFIEGNWWEAFSCEKTYTFPPRVARAFFDCVSAQTLKGEEE